MKREELVNHFGTVRGVAEAFGVTVSAVYQWPAERVPERIAYKAQFLTGGKLQVNPAEYRRQKSA